MMSYLYEGDAGLYLQTGSHWRATRVVPPRYGLVGAPATMIGSYSSGSSVAKRIVAYKIFSYNQFTNQYVTYDNGRFTATWGVSRGRIHCGTSLHIRGLTLWRR